jgi:S1-C subfamily serine protease
MAAMLLSLLLYPAPRDPEPDPLAPGFVGVQLTENVGIVVTRVVPNSPAAKSGLRENDQILKIDGSTFGSVTETAEFIRRCRPGNLIRIEVSRDGKPVTIRLKVGARPEVLP